jgi:RNA polymerase sigma-70 factor (ECF subfamily)
VLLDELWHAAGAGEVELTPDEFGNALAAVGSRHNFGLESAAVAGEREREKYWRGLHLAELALAHGCALGRDAAWQKFMREFRGPLTRAAVAMTRSEALGEELATALYSELFGLTEREGVRWSPLSTYSGQGSLMGWLRAMLAQRQVNQFRKTHRETVLDDMDVAAAPDVAQPEAGTLRVLATAIRSTMDGIEAEDRFLLRAYYLDRRTLLEISRVLRVHEATVSRKVKRAVKDIRRLLLAGLQASGLSRRAAEETLGTDPRDIDVNLRKLLQAPGASAISEGKGRS